ncbi:glycerate kinase [Halobacillus sp. H74]|uniref:glycerate kinase n=1 Tax=Halobacillus sp. H74 TaxID=3457436 RepID=UPI003FCEB340
MNTKKIDLQSIKGSGAAGGLGGALAGIMNAELKSGFTVIAELLRLEDEIRTSDFVLTGEGNLDAQSMHGKVPVSVAEYASKYHVPAIALAGGIELRDHYHPLEAIFSIQSYPCSMEEAIENTYENTKFTTAQIVSLLK